MSPAICSSEWEGLLCSFPHARREGIHRRQVLAQRHLELLGGRVGVGWDGGGRDWLRETVVHKVAGSALRGAFSTLHHEGDAASAGLAGDRGAGLPDK